MSDVVIRRLEAADLEADLTLQRESFYCSPALLRRYGGMPIDDGWVAEADGRVVGGLRAHEVAQRFGGRAIPTVAISGVKVAPEARGRGVGRRLLHTALAERRAAGTGLATLYPSDAGLYRRLGFGEGGTSIRWSLPMLALVPERRGADVAVRWDTDELEPLERCHALALADAPGALVRSAAWWRARALAPVGDSDLYVYAVPGEDGLDGYVSYGIRPGGGRHEGLFELHCRDLVWRTADAADALLRFLAGHRAAAVSLSWPGPPSDPLLLLLRHPEHVALAHQMTWMTRFVDLGAALTARGYPDGAAGELSLAIDDDLLPDNAAPLRLAVADGRAQVEPAASAELTLPAHVFAAIFTGYLDAGVAARLGQLRGEPRAVATLRRLFTSPTPWMTDAF